jgi:hypothetical protein
LWCCMLVFCCFAPATRTVGRRIPSTLWLSHMPHRPYCTAQHKPYAMQIYCVGRLFFSIVRFMVTSLDRSRPIEGCIACCILPVVCSDACAYWTAHTQGRRPSVPLPAAPQRQAARCRRQH